MSFTPSMRQCTARRSRRAGAISQAKRAQMTAPKNASGGGIFCGRGKIAAGTLLKKVTLPSQRNASGIWLASSHANLALRSRAHPSE
ncbi:MAG TPA: hypothetical protein VGC55_10870 [Dokdonella sp.]